MSKWIDRNSFDNNIEYTEKVLERFEINKYNFICENGYTSLIIEKNLKKYRIILNVRNKSLDIYRCEVHMNFAKHTKENYKYKISFNDDCIWNSIRWVAKDCKVKG